MADYTPQTPFEGKLPTPESVMPQAEQMKPASEPKAQAVPPVKKGLGSLDIGAWFQRFQHVSLTERTIFTQNLFIMIKSGIPLSQALGTLAQQTRNKRFYSMLMAMKERIEKGETFSKVLASYPKLFSEIYVSMVAAGEASGKFETILSYLAIQLKKERTIKGKIRSAMFYPILVIVAMIGMGIAMMIFVIPKLSDIYKESNATLPLPTTILIGLSDFVVHHGIIVGIAAVALVILFARLVKTKRGRRILHAVYLRTPILTTIIKKINLARFSRTLHSLLQTDIPIVQSFQIIERTLGNVYYQEAMAEAAQALGKGVTVVQALRKKPRLFPPMVTQMISVGEESGTLDELSNEIANFYEEDVDVTMTNFSSIIEPVLLLILGVAVAGMAVAIMLPMYSLTEQI